jgi:hypothetical protein
MKDRAKSSEEALTTALSFAQKGNRYVFVSFVRLSSGTTIFLLTIYFVLLFRTKVFSGNRSSGLAYVPTLFDSCIRVLQQNMDGKPV